MKKSRRTYNGVHLNKKSNTQDVVEQSLTNYAYRNIRKKWTMPLANWATISQQLAIKFGNRFKLL